MELFSDFTDKIGASSVVLEHAGESRVNQKIKIYFNSIFMR